MSYILLASALQCWRQADWDSFVYALHGMHFMKVITKGQVCLNMCRNFETLPQPGIEYRMIGEKDYTILHCSSMKGCVTIIMPALQHMLSKSGRFARYRIGAEVRHA